MAEGARRVLAQHPNAAALTVGINHDPVSPGVGPYVDVQDAGGAMIARGVPFTWAERDPNVLEEMGLVTDWDNDSDGRMSGVVRLADLAAQVQEIQDGPAVTDDDDDLILSARDGRIRSDLKQRAWATEHTAAAAVAAESFAALQEQYPEADSVEFNIYTDDNGDYVSVCDATVYDALGRVVVDDYEDFDLYDTDPEGAIRFGGLRQESPGCPVVLTRDNAAANLRQALQDDREARW
ncbi:hypothetical protein F8O07_07170 [Pseudoclavibacter sp. CFCC 13796]|uniref:hypothetical protein n=1 Tax=Pseudoclavibacter sp. CFCC 13796 TaxID=2615179 RepID=UPI0013011CEB|nr:hypothetical protein [Pseudoclavibacter sp. CFCC 13796]KAB1661678.1 hypothetical protein F8O07_07170 [Pseudoclavibacter sp. CFCC 13796]